jgi:hypothetical protein
MNGERNSRGGGWNMERATWSKSEVASPEAASPKQQVRSSTAPQAGAVGLMTRWGDPAKAAAATAKRSSE